MTGRLRSALAHDRLPVVLALLAALLSLPAIGAGFVLDDYVLRAISLGRAHEVGLSGSRFDLFTFYSDAPGDHARALDTGWAPWWSSPDNRVRFFRPLSSFTHWLDFQLWPGSPATMHLANVAIYAVLVYAVAVFYRRFIKPSPRDPAATGASWIAGFAALLYAIDPGHAQSVAMLAGRNTVLAALFGVLAIIAHDRSRREGWKPGAPISASLLGASLLAGESGVSTALYLLAYALFLDAETSLAKRARALAPHAIVGIAWVAAYKLLHHGARASSMYTDPGHDPLVYLRDAIVRAPIILHGQLGLPLASLFAALSVRGVIVFAILGALFCALCARLAWPMLRDDRTARFFAAGMLLSVLPVCAIIPNDRVLFFVGLGGLGLVARFIAAALAGADRATRGRKALAFFLVAAHGPLALAFFLFNTRSMDLLAPTSRAPLDEILLEPEVARQTPVFVNAPAHFLISHLSVMRVGTSKPIPPRWRYLAPGIYPLTVSRIDARSLTVRVDGGLLQPPGTWSVEGQNRDPPLHPSYGAQHFAHIVRRADEPMRAGDRLALTGVNIEVREVAPDGRPVEVLFTFDDPLESPSLRWLAWERGRYVRFEPPRIGETVKLGASTMM